jgi:diguanylate cyclase (GGDEF)-like protein
MRKFHKVVLIGLALLFLLMPSGVWGLDTESVLEDPPRILVLFSYSLDFPTTERFLSGLEMGFQGSEVTLHTEFMDTKRIYDEKYVTQFYEMLAYKLEKREPYDLIVVSDDNALQFIADSHKRLFGPLPILFMGVNSEELAYALETCTHITGIIERPSMEAQLALILELFPRMDELIVLRDQTPTGIVEYESFAQALKKFPEIQTRELRSSELTFFEIEDELQTVQGNDVIFLLSSYLDREGSRRDFNEVMLLMRQLTVPVFSPYEFGLGQGTLGGKVIDYTAYGQETAKRALAILDGEAIESFPILNGEETNRYQFDYRELERFLLKEEQLPAGSEILYKPIPFSEAYRELFYLMLSLAVLGMVVLVFLSVWLRMKSKTANLLHEKNLRFLSFFEAVEFPVVILDDVDRIVQSNRPFLKMFNLEKISGNPQLHQVIGQWIEKQPDQYELSDYPYLRAHLNLIVDEEQKLGAYVLFSDESHEKKLEQVLSVYKQTLESNRNSILIADRELCLVWMNQSFLDLVQRKRERLMGVSIRLALEPLSGGEGIWEELEAEGYWAGELSFKEAENYRVFSFSIFAVYDQQDVLNYVGMMEEITERKQQERLLIEMSQKDRLTGLLNRSTYLEQAEAELAKSDSATLYMLNLNHMKVLNDRFGHYFGDEVFKQIANRIKLAFPNVLISRLGGDEFSICYFNMRDEERNESLLKIKGLFDKPYQVGIEEVEVTASVGTARYPKDAKGIPELLTCADLAMSSGRRSQKNRIVAYRKTMKAVANDSYELMTSMKRGIEKNEFYLKYQPIVDGSQKRVVAVEALIRWDHPKLGLISPLRFIPLAEAMGYIHPIGRFVVRQAMKDLTKLPESISMHVNVSLSQLELQDFFEEVQSILREYNIAPERLVLEFTETLPFANGMQIDEFLRDARQEGVQIAIDDFGQGYANLAQLSKISADILKVDQYFVHEIDQNPEHREILQSIVMLSKQFGYQLVAEGVEMQAEAEFLTEMKCLLQGYYYARPMRIEALIRLIDKMHREGGNDHTN